MAGHPEAVKDSNFDEAVIDGSNSQPVLVDFWATWCGPCKMLAPVIEQIADEKTGSLKVLKMDVDENNVTAQRFGIMSIPTMILFKDGKPVKQLVGYQSKDKILSQIGQFLPAKTV